MQQAELIITSGAHSGHHIPLPGSKCIIGRERDCHFRPDDDMISRHHCVIRFDGITYRIRDLGSRNGTFVNGRQIKSDVVLVPDDRIRVGTMTMHISLSAQSDAAANLNQTGFMDGTTVSTGGNASRIEHDTNESFRLPDHPPQIRPESERKSG